MNNSNLTFKIIRSIIFLNILLFTFYASGRETAEESESSQKEDTPKKDKKDKKSEKKETPPSIGNFALPNPQQPGPLVGFGQHVINEDQFQFYLLADYFNGPRRHNIDLAPSLIYGVTDTFSVTFNAPFAVSYKEGKNHSSGWEDIALQLEYAFYNKTTKAYADQATFFTSITFPTGSLHKQPPTGLSSSSFFLGVTLDRLYIDWFGFTSHGVLLTTSDEGTKGGEAFVYQGGVGRNICSQTSEFIFAGLVELDGRYAKKDKIKKIIDPNSGGNTLFITPSLWFSTKKLILQLGIGWPIAQHLFGNQKKNRYVMVANVGWTF